MSRGCSPNLFRRTHIAMMCALGIGLLVCVIVAEPFAADEVPELNLNVGPTTRLLVLAPHPDDEALGAAGLIQRVVGAGGSVRVVLMTSGDAFPEGVEAAT